MQSRLSPLQQEVLERLPVAKLASAEGFDADELERFRRDLVARLL